MLDIARQTPPAAAGQTAHQLTKGAAQADSRQPPLYPHANEFVPAWRQQEVMEPEAFLQDVMTGIDAHFVEMGYNQMWLSDDQAKNAHPEFIKQAVRNRIHTGFYNEIYVRDAAYAMFQLAPDLDLKVQQGFIKQIEDEHKHAIWLLDACQKRGFDPRQNGPNTLMWPIYWNHICGSLNDRVQNDPENIFIGLGSTQLVIEGVLGLRAIPAFCERVANIDPEIAELYGVKIHRDEIFHAIGLPEMIIRKHCTTLHRQNKLREGVERTKYFLQLLFEDANTRMERFRRKLPD